MRIALAGGGTAGHTSPLIATARALQKVDPDFELVCIGTPKGLETTVIPAAGLRLELIDPVPMPRKVNLDLAKLPVRLTKSISQARKILKQHGSQVLVGFGGYVSIPAYFAAKLLRIPIVIHEQNAMPGISNKIGSRFAKITATAFPNTELPNSTFIGMPLRQELTEMATRGRADYRQGAREEFGLDPDCPTLLVSGGSQGAKTLNDATVGALTDLLSEGVQILHVWGPKNFSDDFAVVTADKTNAKYVPVKYVEKMEQAYAAADLMLGRCGAGTVVETAVVGLPAIFVPYPHGNGEQEKNAASLVDAGADVLVTDSQLDAARLKQEVLGLIKNEEKLETMSRAGQGLMPSDSADRFVNLILESVGTAK